MFTLQKSRLFMQQWRDYAQGYKDRAGLPVAERFIVDVDDALHFISANPKACPKKSVPNPIFDHSED